MSQSNPAKKPDPGPKPLSDSAANGQVAGTPSLKDWVAADLAFKQSLPQNISDGGKGVSN